MLRMQGIVNGDGTLCCQPDQYFGYTQSGTANCIDTCID